MIDTIVLKLHDLEKHKHISEFLFVEELDGNTKYHTEIPIQDAEGFIKKASTFKFQWLKFYDTGNDMTLRHFNKKHVPSSHYNIAYSIDWEKDVISFNLSIPKYLYGNNIAQFVKNVNDPNFVLGLAKDLDYHSKYLYERIISFVKYFFQSEFCDMEIDYKEVEVNRIDFCYNQIFQSKDDALQYMDIQKRIPKKFGRSTSNNFANYSTTLSYYSQNYSFKIYHKGTEYAKHDFKRHKKINDELIRTNKNSQLIDTNYLSIFSDRILRYEATYRNRYMSSLYVRKVFRSHLPKYQKLKKQYDKLNSKSKGGTDLQKLNTDQKKFFKNFKKGQQKVLSFFIQNPYDIRDHEQNYYFNFSDHYPRATFSKQLVKELFTQFISMCKEFEIKEMPNIEKVKSRIANENNERKYKSDKFSDVGGFLSKKEQEAYFPAQKRSSRIVMFMKLLETHSFRDIQDMGIFPKTTFYRYKSDLKKLGVSTNNITGYSTIFTSFDFNDYYAECFRNYKSLYYKFKGFTI